MDWADFTPLIVTFVPILSIIIRVIVITCLIMCTIYLGKIYRMFKRKFD